MLKIHEMKNKTLLPFYIYHLLVQNPDLFYLFSIEHIIYAFSIQIVEILNLLFDCERTTIKQKEPRIVPYFKK